MAWHAATSRVENSAQGSPCQLKFVHEYSLRRIKVDPFGNFIHCLLKFLVIGWTDHPIFLRTVILQNAAVIYLGRGQLGAFLRTVILQNTAVILVVFQTIQSVSFLSTVILQKSAVILLPWSRPIRKLWGRVRWRSSVRWSHNCPNFSLTERGDYPS